MDGRDGTLDQGTAPRAATRAGGHGLIREGIVTGAIGATAVALWFLVVDLVMGRPLHTPALLGAVVALSPDPLLAAEGAGRAGLAALYTVLHYIAFALVGVLAVFLVHRAERAPALLGLLLMLFAVIEVAFVGFIAVLEIRALGDIAWYQVAVGNLIAAVTMGWYLWRSHPTVGTAYRAGFQVG
jgi:hypothetical protein